MLSAEQWSRKRNGTGETAVGAIRERVLETRIKNTTHAPLWMLTQFSSWLYWPYASFFSSPILPLRWILFHINTLKHLPVERVENQGIVSGLSWRCSSPWKAVMEDKRVMLNTTVTTVTVDERSTSIVSYLLMALQAQHSQAFSSDSSGELQTSFSSELCAHFKFSVWVYLLIYRDSNQNETL